MRKVVCAALALTVFGLSRGASASIGTIDPVPAATLLLPYFEVDLANAGGATTLFSINNASASSVLAHVTLWTDFSIATKSFDVYLTGYDVQSINVRDVLNGFLPQTATAGQDNSDTISPKGTLSQDINFVSCTGQLPPATLAPGVVADLKAAHTGQPVLALFGSTKCASLNYGDNIARGYITVDTVNTCTTKKAGDAGYIGTEVTNQNVLWGDYFYLNPAQNLAEGDTLVHIEASATDPLTTTSGHYTFYGRYDGWTAADNREPLATTFLSRFINGGAFSGGTRLDVWRDTKVNQAPFTCGGAPPSWYPLSQEQIVIFDEQEHPVVTPIFPFFPQPTPVPLIPFPVATQSTPVGGVGLPVPYSFGWLYLNLNTTVAGNPNPPFDPTSAQAWVTAIHRATGNFSVGYGATQYDNASAPNHSVIPVS